MGIAEDWGLTLKELNAVLSERPSLRGALMGFLAEYRLQQKFFHDSRFHKLQRHDDQDRKRPGDFTFTYQGREISVEVKSVKSNSVRSENGGFRGTCSVDASDKRGVTFPDGSTLATTCVLAGKFDVLAVNLYEFRQKWEFAFIRNKYLPRAADKRYTDYQRRHLLATNLKIHWPLEAPFYDTIEPILEIRQEWRTSERKR